MRAGYQKKVMELKQQLRPGEQLEEVALFNCTVDICAFFVVAIGALIVGRMFGHVIPVLLLTNLISMWMMVDAARALFQVQNSCVLVTDRRTFGVSGGKQFELPHRKLINVAMGRVLFLDGGDAYSSVVLRNLSNKNAVYTAISCHRK
ncbi:MAG: hypothetical protein AB7E30_05960 [Lawsonibacter sp.]